MCSYYNIIIATYFGLVANAIPIDPSMTVDNDAYVPKMDSLDTVYRSLSEMDMGAATPGFVELFDQLDPHTTATIVNAILSTPQRPRKHRRVAPYTLEYADWDPTTRELFVPNDQAFDTPRHAAGERVFSHDSAEAGLQTPTAISDTGIPFDAPSKKRIPGDGERLDRHKTARNLHSAFSIPSRRHR